MDRKQKALIRTGCIACLALGVRCRPGNSGCKRYQSTLWISNQDSTASSASEGKQLQIRRQQAESLSTPSLNASGWQGTNREVQSLHFFSVVSAPELAGYVDGPFWQTYILGATQQDDAIKHAVAALGAHHEYRLRQQAARYNKETEGLWQFALRQCNKAIRSLMTKVCATRGTAIMRMLTASLLFVCFESMTGRKDIALSHVFHARRLATYGKRLLKNDKRGCLNSVMAQDFRTMEPLVAHYESQLTQWKLREDEKSSLDRLDVDRPIVIKHLIDARVTLVQGIAYMTEIIFALLDSTYTEADIREMTLNKHRILIWFQRWERTFQDFLRCNQDQLSAFEIIHGKLFLTHYYGVYTICATDMAKGEDNWATFTPEFRQLLTLATEIVEAQPFHTMSWQAPQTPHFSSTMGLSQPLYICASRCTDPEIAARAVKLLGKLPPSEGAKSHFRTEIMERHLRAVTGNKQPFGKST